jgi:hypothetical protein
MHKVSRVIVSVLVSLAAAVTAAVALSAPAQAMTVAPNTNTNASMQVVSVTLSDGDIAKVAVSYYWAEALCADTSDAVITASSSWFAWDAPTPNGQVGVQRCAWDLYDCVKAGGRSVTFANYAGFWGWTYWKDTCNVG